MVYFNNANFFHRHIKKAAHNCDRPTLYRSDERLHGVCKSPDKLMQIPCKPAASKRAVHVNQN